MSDPLCLGVVRFGAMDVALPAELIEEIVRGPLELAPFPRAAAHVLGAFAFRGAPVPVVDLATLIQPAAVATIQPPVAYAVIVQHAAGRFAFLADQISSVVNAPPDAVTELTGDAATVSSRLFSRLYTPTDGGRVVAILDFDAVLRIDGLHSAVAAQREEESAKTEQRTQARRPHVLFRAGNACFGLDVNYVRQVDRRPLTADAAPSDAVLRGFRRFREDDLAVIDLLALLKLPAGRATPTAAHYVVVERAGQAVALAVDELVATESVATEELSAVPEGGMACPEFYAGCWVNGAGEIVLVLKPEILIEAASVVDRASLFAKTEAAENTTETATGEFARYVVYRAGGGTLATPLVELEAVMNLPAEFVDLRGRSHALVGMCARQGRSFKVVDLGALMSRPHPDPAPGAPMLVVKTEDATVGYLVESVDFLQGAIPRALPAAGRRGPGVLPPFRETIRARAENFDRAASVLSLASLTSGDGVARCGEEAV